MGTLCFVCPRSGRKVVTGLDVDLASLKSLRNEQLSCPECKGLHEFSEIWSWVTDEGSPDPDNVTA